MKAMYNQLHMRVNGPTRHQLPLLFYAAGRALYRDHGEPYVPCYTPLMVVALRHYNKSWRPINGICISRRQMHQIGPPKGQLWRALNERVLSNNNTILTHNVCTSSVGIICPGVSLWLSPECCAHRTFGGWPCAFAA